MLHFKAGGRIDVYVDIGEHKIEEPSLTALGLYWSLENTDWRYKITRRARDKVLDMMEEDRERETKPTGTKYLKEA